MTRFLAVITDRPKNAISLSTSARACSKDLGLVRFHFVLLGDHATQSPFLAAGFLAAGVGQLQLATLVAVRPSRPIYRAVIVLDVFLVLFYLAHVVVGLPLPSGVGFELEFSPRESVDVAGVRTVIAELAAVGLAYAGLLARTRPQRPVG